MRYLRSFAVATLCGGFVSLLFFGQQSSGQQSPPSTKEALTPEQKDDQQEWKAYMAKRRELQAQAKEIFDAEMAREKAADCPDAKTTYDINICYGKQAAITDQNLKSYEKIVGELIALNAKLAGHSATNTNGPAGPVLTPDQLRIEFDRVEQAWRDYSSIACTAAFHQYGGGTGGPGFQVACELMLARGHMRELNVIFDGELNR